MYLNCKHSFNKWQLRILGLMFSAVDPSALAIFRITYGFLMMLDVLFERGLSVADEIWGNANICHFPLFHSWSPLSLDWMCIIYLIMLLGTIGITFGYNFHYSCIIYLTSYWYIVLLDKSAWNNHTYLFGLIGLLLLCTNANTCWSIDSWMHGTNGATHVPFWNYFILRFQVFILYFMAGVKKMNYEWLSGYAMLNLSHHWVFNPFKIILTEQQIDFWIIHVAGFLIDILSGFGLCFRLTRPFTLLMLFLFNSMNSRMFSIGMFPYVAFMVTLIFCDNDWPKKLIGKKCKVNSLKNQQINSSSGKKILTMLLITMYMMLQSFLPFSHFITKGYNAWTNGLYGYSWDMMVHNWEPSMVMVKVLNNKNGESIFIDKHAWVLTDKWTKHPDMIIQYSQCIKHNLQKHGTYYENISIYMDIWYSLNRRFLQRMYNPNVDLLTAEWSPLQKVSWVMPLLTDLTNWRHRLRQIEEQTRVSSNSSEVLFVADFPGLSMESFVESALENVTITVLKGRTKVVTNDQETLLDEGMSEFIPSNTFHIVQIVSNFPTCYMYQYQNKSAIHSDASIQESNRTVSILEFRINAIRKSVRLIAEAVIRLLQ